MRVPLSSTFETVATTENCVRDGVKLNKYTRGHNSIWDFISNLLDDLIKNEVKLWYKTDPKFSPPPHFQGLWCRLCYCVKRAVYHCNHEIFIRVQLYWVRHCHFWMSDGGTFHHFVGNNSKRCFMGIVSSLLFKGVFGRVYPYQGRFEMRWQIYQSCGTMSIPGIFTHKSSVTRVGYGIS